MATTKEMTVEEKLRLLYDLQLIDSRIDEIRNVRGELPLEVEDLDAEVAGLSTRLERLGQEVENIEEQIKEKKNNIEDNKAHIKKYKEQKKEVRNNRNLNSLKKEIEYQELEIQLAKKHNREYQASIQHKKDLIAQTEEKLAMKSEHLAHKKT